MEREVAFEKREGELAVRLRVEIDHHSAKRIRERIDTELFREKPGLLVLDFSQVSFMDSSGIGLIIGRADICREIGGRVKLTGLSGSIAKVVRLSGIEKINNVFISDV